MVAGAVIFAKDLERISAFYRAVLGGSLEHADQQHHVIGPEPALTIHAIPGHLVERISVPVPPDPRLGQSIKLVFRVASLVASGAEVARLGGGMLEPGWKGAGFIARDGFDPEGNVFQLREPGSSG